MGQFLRLTISDPRWLERIKQDPAATIFHYPAWLKMLSACYRYRPFIAAVLDGSDQICAGLPIAEVNDHLTPRRWVALPFSDYCAPLTSDEESQRTLVSALVDQQQRGLCPKLEIRAGLPDLPDVQPQFPYVIHTVALEPDSEHVAKRASRQQMQNVRTAEKNGVRVVRGTGLAETREFYRLHSLSRRKHGMPVQPWSFFKHLVDHLFSQGLGFILLAYQADTCISAGLFLHWQKTLTYKYSSTDENYLNLRPNHLVTWTAMRWGCENGFTTFDFGRADLEDEGLRSYKRRWGSEETPLCYSYIPASFAPERKGSGKFAELAKTMIRRSPVWVSRIVGELLYRYAG